MNSNNSTRSCSNSKKERKHVRVKVPLKSWQFNWLVFKTGLKLY